MLGSLRHVMRLTHPPRMLFTGQKNYEVVGPPGDVATQMAIIKAALRMLVDAREPGTLESIK